MVYPECGWEREVHFFEATVRGVCYCYCEAGREGRVKGCKIAFKPAERSRHDDLVEDFGDARRRPGGCDGYFGVWGLRPVEVERRRLCGEAELGFCERGTGNPGENGPVGVRNEEIF